MNISLPNGSSRHIISWNGFIPCCCFWSVTFFGAELHQTTSGYKNRVRIQAPRVVSIIAGKPITGVTFMSAGDGSDCGRIAL